MKKHQGYGPYRYDGPPGYHGHPSNYPPNGMHYNHGQYAHHAPPPFHGAHPHGPGYPPFMPYGPHHPHGMPPMPHQPHPMHGYPQPGLLSFLLFYIFYTIHIHSQAINLLCYNYSAIICELNHY